MPSEEEFCGIAANQELSYDAWGRLRNPATQTAYTPGNEPVLFLGRGYTGHECLPCIVEGFAIETTLENFDRKLYKNLLTSEPNYFERMT